MLGSVVVQKTGLHLILQVVIAIVYLGLILYVDLNFDTQKLCKRIVQTSTQILI